MTWADAIAAYLEYIAQHRGRTPGHAANIRRRLTGLARHLEAQGYPGPGAVEDDSPVLRGLQALRRERGLGDGTYYNAVSIVRHAWRWWYSHRAPDGARWAVWPVHDALESPRVAQRHPRALAPELVAVLLSQPDISTLAGQRDFAMMALSYGSGIRPGELVTLELSRLQPYRGTIWVRGKGARDGEAELTPHAARVLAWYLRQVRPRLLGRRRDPGLVFLSTWGRPMTYEVYRERFRAYALASGIVPPPVPHQLRHSLGQHVYDTTGDLLAVKDLLRHSQISSTMHYVRGSQANARARLREMVARLWTSQEGAGRGPLALPGVALPEPPATLQEVDHAASELRGP